MIKYGISNIRQLVGHRVDLPFIYDSPICRFDAAPAAAPKPSDGEAEKGGSS